MSISLRDLKLAKSALHAECRLHAGHLAATCNICHGFAAAQRDKQHHHQRAAAHAKYLRERVQ